MSEICCPDKAGNPGISFSGRPFLITGPIRLPLVIAVHQRRSNQIRRAIPCGVISMAESAGGDEALTPPFDGGWIGIIVGEGRERMSRRATWTRYIVLIIGKTQYIS